MLLPLTVSLWCFSGIFLSVIATPAQLAPRAACQASYTACKPSGAKSTSSPPVGSALSSLFVDLLDSIQGVPNPSKRKREVDDIARVLGTRDISSPICCAPTTLCLLLQEFDVPFCYDRFTTNYFLPDGSYGSIDTGLYTGSDGSNANLIDGSYTLKDGVTGNVYKDASISALNIATLTLPKPFTGTGIGSAIPANELGSLETYTTTIPATTMPGSTIPATVLPAITISADTTIPATTVNGQSIAGTTVTDQTIRPTTISAQSVAATTEPAIVKPAQTRTVVTSVAKASKTGGAGSLPRPLEKANGSLLGLVMIALFML
ncbi:MAG: hypothetical protein M1824_006334 [Vezdaea acicularis]|nr:MAG: hypothetical protein M1824_006334 [Vezdaea acicularis]